MMDAIHEALETELAADDRVMVAGIDVGEGGNVFGLTRGLRERCGERVRATPLSETAVMRLGVVAAMAGGSEERRGGEGGGGTCESRWAPCHEKKKKHKER